MECTEQNKNKQQIFTVFLRTSEMYIIIYEINVI